jgi:hypothetical protein
MVFKKTCIFLVLFSLSYSCGDDSTGSNTGFQIFGRVVYRPLLTGPSIAVFYVFDNDQPVTDAEILVGADTVRHSQATDGYYRADVQISMGDTLKYSVHFQFGSDSGTVVIPDTVTIVTPAFDTLNSGVGFYASWHSNLSAEGYFVYLENQGGYVAEVSETAYDTTAQLSGEYLLNIGADRFWVETLDGVFYRQTAPNGLVLPRGVVGAAGNFREVYIDFSP